MVFKPNYNQQRAERDRNKQAKKEAKLREREEANRRKAETDAAPQAAQGTRRKPGGRCVTGGGRPAPRVSQILETSLYVQDPGQGRAHSMKVCSASSCSSRMTACAPWKCRASRSCCCFATA